MEERDERDELDPSTKRTKRVFLELKLKCVRVPFRGSHKNVYITSLIQFKISMNVCQK